MSTKKVLITGCTGQAGSLMADYLLKETDHEIYGMVRRLSVSNHDNINHLKNNPRFHLITGDLTDGHSLYECINTVRPDYFINAAAQSFVAESWNSPVNTFETDAVAIIHILEAIRKLVPSCRFINFASSEMFGDVQYTPQDIKHPFRSRSPYAAAKVAAHQIVKVYRESYNLYACSIIAYNYEGIRRGKEFVTRKITHGVARIKYAIDHNLPFEPLELGNVLSKRDWSDAEDVVDAVWRILNQEKHSFELGRCINYGFCGNLDRPDAFKYLTENIKEYIVASGEIHTVQEFVQWAFHYAGIDGSWISGQRVGEPERPENWAFIDLRENKALAVVNPKFYRPAEVSLLCGDSAPIREELGWKPKTSFCALVKKMVENDILCYKP